MDKDKVNTFLGYLAEISAYLIEEKYRVHENDSNLSVSEAVERYLDGFNISPSGERVAPLRNISDVLQLNSRNEKLVNSNLLKGDKELIKLKYGQGSISVRLRYNKNGTIYKTYQGRYYDEFGKVKSVYGKTQQECLRKLKEAHPTKKGKPAKQVFPTVQEWMLHWYNEYKKGTIRHSSQRGYEQQMNAYIFPALGKIKLPALTTDYLQHFFNKIEAGNVRKKIYLLLSACLKKAVLLKKIQFNPCDAVELPKFKKKKRRPYEYSEQNALLSEENNVAQAFFFLCATGLRVGEFLALTKDDFYPDQSLFKVDKAIVQGIEGETKSDASNRTVYYTEELFEHFDLNLLGTFTYPGLRSGFSRLLKKHDISGVSLHCTRHTYATICHSFGMNDKTLQSQLGHSTLAMTQDVYTHLLKKGESKIRTYLEQLCTHIRNHI